MEAGFEDNQIHENQSTKQKLNNRLLYGPIKYCCVHGGTQNFIY